MIICQIFQQKVNEPTLQILCITKFSTICKREDEASLTVTTFLDFGC